MPPSVFVSLSTTLAACGACADANLVRALPFIGWWMLLFLLWSLLLGPLIFSYVRAGQSTDLRHPTRYFWLYLVLFVVGIVVVDGAFLLVFLPVIPFWLWAMVAGIRDTSPGWRNFCITVLGVMILLAPTSYVFSTTKPRVQHGAKPAELPGQLFVPNPAAAKPAVR